MSSLTKNTNKKNVMIVAAALALVIAVVALIVSSQSSPATSTTEERTTLKIGIPQDDQIWDTFKEVALRDYDLEIETVQFSDWHLPNTALAAGELDANAFQHTLFVSNFNASANETLRPIGNYGVTTAGFFSEKVSSIADLEDGASVLFHKDPSNQGRALKLLEAEGLIELRAENSNFPGLDDVIANPKNLDFKEVDGLQLPSALPDGDLVFIYYHQAIRAGIDAETALINDKELLETDAFLGYHGVIVVEEENAENPLHQSLVDIYKSDEVRAAVEDEYEGQTIILDIPAERFLEVQVQAEAELNSK